MTTIGEIVRERALSSKKELHQVFVEEGKERHIRWSVEIRGFVVPGYDRLGTVAGTERLIPDRGIWGYALPHETPYGLRITSDCECNAEIFIDGIDAAHSQGVFRIMPGTSSWITRPTSEARAFTLLGVDTEEGRAAGVKDDEHAGCVIVKVSPVVLEDTEEVRARKIQEEMEDGIAKCRKKKKSTRGYAAAGTGLGAEVSQRFSSAEQKRVVGSCDHLQMSCVLMCKEKSSKYSPVYKPEMSSRAAFGL